jgi:hypothetical protein
MTRTAFILILVIVAAGARAQEPADSTGAAGAGENGYRIDQPGTITFTVGVKIKGKVEKPQVMIFLPKEKTWRRDMRFEHSFREDILAPLEFAPIVE